MKNKIISILLACFIFISSSLTCFAENKNSRFVDGGVISGPMLATLVTVAVGGGIIISSSDSIVDMGRLFYEKNKENWEAVNSVFNSCVSIGKDKMVSVGSDFMNILKDFFDSTFSSADSDIVVTGVVNDTKYPRNINLGTINKSITGNVTIEHGYYETDKYKFSAYVGDTMVWGAYTSVLSSHLKGYTFRILSDNYGFYLNIGTYNDNGVFYNSTKVYLASAVVDDVITFPYSGGYDWDKVKDNQKEDGSVSVGVPGNLGDLVVSPGDVFNPTYDLPIGGVIDFPLVENPSISIDKEVSIPTEGAGEGAGEGTGDITFPSFGDSIDFSPLEATGITDKFPFSLPWDIQRILGIFNVEPKAPVFNVPIVTEKVKIDLTEFDDWAVIVRFFVFVGFIISLIMISTKLKG